MCVGVCMCMCASDFNFNNIHNEPENFKVGVVKKKKFLGYVSLFSLQLNFILMNKGMLELLSHMNNIVFIFQLQQEYVIFMITSYAYYITSCQFLLELT